MLKLILRKGIIKRFADGNEGLSKKKSGSTVADYYKSEADRNYNWM